MKANISIVNKDEPNIVLKMKAFIVNKDEPNIVLTIADHI